MNCEEVRELLPAYVLGALEDEEVEELEAHLRLGSEHEDELADLRLTVFALDRFADERSLEAADARQRQRISGWGWLSRLRPRTNLPAALPAWRPAFATLVLLAVFAGGWAVAQISRGPAEQNVSLLIQGAGGQAVSLNGASSQKDVRVTMAGLPRLPSERVYQIWAIRDGAWMRIGVCNTDAQGAWQGTFGFRISPGDGLAVTVEPKGGSERPTSAPILTSGPLTG